MGKVEADMRREFEAWWDEEEDLGPVPERSRSGYQDEDADKLWRAFSGGIGVGVKLAGQRLRASLERG